MSGERLFPILQDPIIRAIPWICHRAAREARLRRTTINRWSASPSAAVLSVAEAVLRPLGQAVEDRPARDRRADAGIPLHPNARGQALRTIQGSRPMTSDSKWKLVPVEPTPAMAFAGIHAVSKSKTYDKPGVPGFDADLAACNGDAGAVRAMQSYRAMLAASPQPPAPGAEVVRTQWRFRQERSDGQIGEWSAWQDGVWFGPKDGPGSALKSGPSTPPHPPQRRSRGGRGRRRPRSSPVIFG